MKRINIVVYELSLLLLYKTIKNIFLENNKAY